MSAAAAGIADGLTAVDVASARPDWSAGVDAAFGGSTGARRRFDAAPCFDGVRRRGGFLAGISRRSAVGVFAVDESIAVVIDYVRARRLGRFRQAGSDRQRSGRFVAGELICTREADTERRDDAEAGQSYGQCELVPHATAPLYPQPRVAQPVSVLSLCNRPLQATCSPRGAQRHAAAPNKPLINAGLMTAGQEDFRRAGWAG